MQIQKVLLVDEDLDIQTIVEMSLEIAGAWALSIASSGQQALEMARAAPPDVVLLDVMMPGMDGPTTFGKLREEPSTAEIPIIFFTGRTHGRDVERLLALGAAGIIAKPFDPLELSQQILRILEEQRSPPAAR